MKPRARNLFIIAGSICICILGASATNRECFCKNADTLAVNALNTNECCVDDGGGILDVGCVLPESKEDTFAQCCLNFGEIGSCGAED